MGAVTQFQLNVGLTEVWIGYLITYGIFHPSPHIYNSCAVGTEINHHTQSWANQVISTTRFETQGPI